MAILLGGIVIFVLYGTQMTQALMSITRHFLGQAPQIILHTGSINILMLHVREGLFSLLLPLFVAVIIVGVLVNFLQVGVLFTTKPLVPDFKKISPQKGFGRLFSKTALVELVKSVCKIIIVGAVAYFTIKAEAAKIPMLADMSTWDIAGFVGRTALKIIFHTAWVLIILGVMDFCFQKWNHEQSLKMTKQEIKDEFKQREGDPLVKSRIRRIQLETARKRMMADVPKADVVVTNPVHLAVALQYDGAKMDSPMVVAKGARLIAEQIKKIARKHNVPVVENKALAQSLFKMVAVGETIPESLYKAVAEVLAYVYKLKNKQAAAY